MNANKKCGRLAKILPFGRVQSTQQKTQKDYKIVLIIQIQKVKDKSHLKKLKQLKLVKKVKEKLSQTLKEIIENKQLLSHIYNSIELNKYNKQINKQINKTIQINKLDYSIQNIYNKINYSYSFTFLFTNSIKLLSFFQTLPISTFLIIQLTLAIYLSHVEICMFATYQFVNQNNIQVNQILKPSNLVSQFVKIFLLIVKRAINKINASSKQGKKQINSKINQRKK
ncbi:transmembrane protein, putative (macronuclear) [Tetrahymena thermophila SB210]|uniref:Transmembrane protein, putative n=1 Tax=Tetrahymena thermophila (strain SB210) TaxID=312017 RepID=W7X0G4_TETTS|nr:transmembrane protein, putative [Tetrahymena thermophila SB210]EWS72615.1 transmembrane protein, putative [Tetrahymena thermophila SB210]|eukprot:XP_012654898.1 transmembrane protein, putative [Tetrahymena thermophila SB210]